MKILLLGEKCLDVFMYGDCNRLNPEAPTPVITPYITSATKGMAGNVYNNIKGLNPKLGIDFVYNDKLIRKTRYIDKNSNYILLRVDENDKVDRISSKIVDKLIKKDNLKAYKAVVISSYNKGFLLSDDIFKISQKCHILNIPTFLDSKDIFSEKYQYIDFIKINQTEYENNLKHNINPDDFCRKGTIVTLGKRGMQFKGKVYPIDPIEVRDVVGCGDSALAGLVVKYLEQGDIIESIKFANKVARIAASKKGTVTVYRKDIV